MQIENHQLLLDTYRIFLDADIPKGGKAIINTDGVILRANDRNLIFSLEEDALLSSILPKITQVLSPKTLQKSITHNKSIRCEITVAERETDYCFQLTISPLIAEVTALFLVEFTDITHYKSAVVTVEKQRRRIEEELLLRTREIVQTDLFTKDHGGFLANFMRGLRHDLHSPIAQLKDIIDYNRTTDDPQKKEYSARLIDDCLEKLSNTARGFSDFVDLHILPHSNMETIEIDKLFTEVRELLSENITRTKANISTNFTEAPTFFFNKMIMSSIVYNLLSNAIRFRRKDTVPVIFVRTSTEGSDFIFSIKDNGLGIDLAAHASKLFVPFQRLHPDASGGGVGLSMIKNALVEYGGDIQVESAIGKGTTVRVCIPTSNK